MRITTFDEGGYLSGQRIRPHGSKDLFFEEVGSTNAFIGDLETVTLVNHESVSKNLNYRYAVAQKQLKQMLAFADGYTWQAGTQAIRAAVVVDIRKMKEVNRARIEGEERPNRVTFAGLADPQISPVLPLQINGPEGLAVTPQQGVGRLSGSVETPQSTGTTSSMQTAASFILSTSR